MNTAIVVQARTSSSRLPGKVLLPLLGEPLLARMLERLQAMRTAATLVVATTVDPSDDPIVSLCHRLGVRVFRGHPTDCLERHLGAAESVAADVVVKIPSDCPLIDPAVVDRVLAQWAQSAGRYDYLSNLHPPSWPDGQDVEVMSFDALSTANREATRPLEREHTTPFFWENPERFALGNVAWERDLFQTHRWVVDYPDDLRFVAAVFEKLYRQKPIFSVEDVVELVENHPHLAQLNQRYAGVNWYRHHLHELKTVSADDTRQAPEDAAV